MCVCCGVGKKACRWRALGSVRKKAEEKEVGGNSHAVRPASTVTYLLASSVADLSPLSSPSPWRRSTKKETGTRIPPTYSRASFKIERDRQTWGREGMDLLGLLCGVALPESVGCGPLFAGGRLLPRPHG